MIWFQIGNNVLTVKVNCYGINTHKDDVWCSKTCAHGYCPSSSCKCDDLLLTTHEEREATKPISNTGPSLTTTSTSSVPPILTPIFRIKESEAETFRDSKLPVGISQKTFYSAVMSKPEVWSDKLVCKAIGSFAGSLYMDR